VNLMKITTESEMACVFMFKNCIGLNILSIISVISNVFVEHVTRLARLTISKSLIIIRRPPVKSLEYRCQNTIIIIKGSKGFKRLRLNLKICQPNKKWNVVIVKNIRNIVLSVVIKKIPLVAIANNSNFKLAGTLSNTVGLGKRRANITISCFFVHAANIQLILI